MDILVGLMPAVEDVSGRDAHWRRGCGGLGKDRQSSCRKADVWGPVRKGLHLRAFERGRQRHPHLILLLRMCWVEGVEEERSETWPHIVGISRCLHGIENRSMMLVELGTVRDVQGL